MSKTIPKISRSVYGEVVKFVGPNCKEVTNYYKNCRPPFRFSHGKFATSCCAECMKHLSEWLVPLLKTIPKNFKHNGNFYELDEDQAKLLWFVSVSEIETGEEAGEGEEEVEKEGEWRIVVGQHEHYGSIKTMENAIESVQALYNKKSRPIEVELPYNLTRKATPQTLPPHWTPFIPLLTELDSLGQINLSLRTC